MDANELENRLEKFSVGIINLCDGIIWRDSNRHLLNQLVRSASSAALNYAEAQAAESKRDFIHKNRIVLKELKETLTCLGILRLLFQNKVDMIQPQSECEQLVRIFVVLIRTASIKQP